MTKNRDVADSGAQYDEEGFYVEAFGTEAGLT